ncbi:hypothetical protein N7452_008384 [Penicillium brevicompactum]|uniref:Uncharacterized protein n=1 Tax=Penicillium brevicompactum TaxID=5074 RepID=A0A9W9UA70_PENBR|nr:hypothetical protein N7452_008384 [Penicillium brevicompactum]
MSLIRDAPLGQLLRWVTGNRRKIRALPWREKPEKELPPKNQTRNLTPHVRLLKGFIVPSLGKGKNQSMWLAGMGTTIPLTQEIGPHGRKDLSHCKYGMRSNIPFHSESRNLQAQLFDPASIHLSYTAVHQFMFQLNRELDISSDTPVFH